MLLNQLARRLEGSVHFPALLPWVTDFSTHPLLMLLNVPIERYRVASEPVRAMIQLPVPGCSTQNGWRDLSKSKYLLHKGLLQINTNFLTSAHHVTENWSDLTYFGYTARRTPMPLLQRHVRANFEPAQYPASMEYVHLTTFKIF
jgi:WD repeat-containing protein 81